MRNASRRVEGAVCDKLKGRRKICRDPRRADGSRDPVDVRAQARYGHNHMNVSALMVPKIRLSSRSLPDALQGLPIQMDICGLPPK